MQVRVRDLKGNELPNYEAGRLLDVLGYAELYANLKSLHVSDLADALALLARERASLRYEGEKEGAPFFAGQLHDKYGLTIDVSVEGRVTREGYSEWTVVFTLPVEFTPSVTYLLGRLRYIRDEMDERVRSLEEKVKVLERQLTAIESLLEEKRERRKRFLAEEEEEEEEEDWEEEEY